MSETHVRGVESALNPITGEPPGIKEILERRAAGGMPDRGEPVETRTEEPPEVTPPEPRETDDADAAVREMAGLRMRVSDAENRANAEATARAEAERGRIAAENARTAALQGAEDTNFTAINTALIASTRERDSLVVELKTAGEAGDFSRMGEISGRLGELGAEIRDLSQGKNQLEQDRQTRVSSPPPPPPEVRTAPPVISDPVERGILSNLRAPSREAFLQSRTPATRDFLYQHPEFFTDPAAHQRMVGAESMARGNGVAVDSPAYFEAIRGAATLRQPTQARPAATERAVPTATPPSRVAPGPTGQRVAAGDVYVSAEDAKVADWMQVDPVEYVSERQRLEQRGEWPYRRR